MPIPNRIVCLYPNLSAIKLLVKTETIKNNDGIVVIISTIESGTSLKAAAIIGILALIAGAVMTSIETDNKAIFKMFFFHDSSSFF